MMTKCYTHIHTLKRLNTIFQNSGQRFSARDNPCNPFCHRLLSTVAALRSPILTISFSACFCHPNFSHPLQTLPDTATSDTSLIPSLSAFHITYPFLLNLDLTIAASQTVSIFY